MKPVCWIVTPTLNARQGQKAVQSAKKTAGVPIKTLYVVDEKREGGMKTANRCFKQAVGTPYVCYINDDVSFPQQDWLKMLIEALETKPRYAVVGPSGRCGVLPQKNGKPGMEFRIREVNQLSFFCAVFKRTALKKLGYFDKDFIHWGCDSYWCFRARNSGWKVTYAQHVWVDHDYSTMEDRPESGKLRRWQRHDRRMYRRKKRQLKSNG